MYFLHVREHLTSGDLRFCFKRKKVAVTVLADREEDPCEQQSSAQSTKILDSVGGEQCRPVRLDCNKIALKSCDRLDHFPVPFLVRFEAERARQVNTANESKIVYHFTTKADEMWDCQDSCKFLNCLLTHGDRGRYGSELRKPISTNDTGLYFHAELDSNYEIRLLRPDRALSRRIFRKFGSHRLLHVKVDPGLLDQCVIQKFTRKNLLRGRMYTHLWCKAQKSPQGFVLFAESGFDIENEMSADQVRDWRIPRELNPELTVGKELKRMKLCFCKTCKTMPACALTENTIELIDDIVGDNGGLMTDGTGLVSRDALNQIWKGYSSESTPCPFSSFQGRIGGFKGMWVLDDSLQGIQIKCRQSQLKLNVPMKSLASPNPVYTTKEDPFYDTVDIIS